MAGYDVVAQMIAEFQGPYRFLSNFWSAAVCLDGIAYPTVEHAYQAARTDDPNRREIIRECRTPGQAKRLGRVMPTRAGWGEARLDVMLDLLWQKFSWSDLAAALLATGDEELREGNRWGDRFWGVDADTGIGENHLGRLLMRVRAGLREGVGSTRETP